MLLVYENKEVLLIGETKGLLISFNYDDGDFNLRLLVKLVDRDYFNLLDNGDYAVKYKTD